ncbi:hypothetical protein BDZ91DRAFT_798831 [Kalaharituber pfeilii]|nr:hypothetical protein BDZ91DRAFT_798831 [Kalaharituber pfeilii]
MPAGYLDSAIFSRRTWNRAEEELGEGEEVAGVWEQDIGQDSGDKVVETSHERPSSVVVYLEEEREIDRVRLGGKLLRTTQYEPDRRRE